MTIKINSENQRSWNHRSSRVIRFSCNIERKQNVTEGILKPCVYRHYGISFTVTVESPPWGGSVFVSPVDVRVQLLVGSLLTLRTCFCVFCPRVGVSQLLITSCLCSEIFCMRC